MPVPLFIIARTMVKIRLARQGRKKLPIYKLVAADSRSRRDGRFIEALGQYRPSNEPGQKVALNEDRVMYWLKNGAQPTTTVRSLLSKEGILLKWHLEKKKIDATRAEEIVTTWKSNRDNKIANMATDKERKAAEAKRKAEADKAAKLAADAAAAKAEEEAAAAAAAPAAEETAPVAEAAEAPAEG